MPEYVGGVLRAEKASRLEAHLFVCEECQAELTSVKDFSGALYAMHYDGAPEELSVDRVLALKSEHVRLLAAAGTVTNVVPFVPTAKEETFERVIGAWPMLAAAASFLIVGLLSVPYARWDMDAEVPSVITQASETQPSQYAENHQSQLDWGYRPVAVPRATQAKMTGFSRIGLIFPPENSTWMGQHLSQSARYGLIFPRGDRNG